MQKHETTHNFLRRRGIPIGESENFYIYRVGEAYLGETSPFTRREYYKISLLLEGESVLSYADRTIPVNRPALVFSNPLIPYAWQPVSETQTGYFCLFTEKFVNHQLKTESPAESPLFKVQGDHVLFPDTLATERIRNIFETMLQEAAGDYKYKQDVQRNHVQLLIHEALKITPPMEAYTRTTSAHRITSLFLELLARQFPISSTHDRIRIKTAAGFATQLSVHVNHLNKSVKTATGKTTTVLIAEQVASEAKALLQHTDWDVAAIGYCLGFEHAANFSIFFRRMAGETPNHFRANPISK